MHPKELLRKGRSPLSAKSVWLAISLFIGGGGAMVSGPADSKLASMLQVQAPSLMTVAESYLDGFFIGWDSRLTIKLTSIINGIALAIIISHPSCYHQQLTQSKVRSARIQSMHKVFIYESQHPL